MSPFYRSQYQRVGSWCLCPPQPFSARGNIDSSRLGPRRPQYGPYLSELQYGPYFPGLNASEQPIIDVETEAEAYPDEESDLEVQDGQDARPQPTLDIDAQGLESPNAASLSGEQDATETAPSLVPDQAPSAPLQQLPQEDQFIDSNTPLTEEQSSEDASYEL